jgi:putative hydrolase of the HAD superfamily
MSLFDLIAFDADDTLWHTERLYVDAQAGLAQLLAPYASPETVHERLYKTESRNIEYFGYGIKSFTLSMIETAVEVMEGSLPGPDVLSIIELAREMLKADVELLEHAAETVVELAPKYRLIMITKGDLYDQETKVARSGLEDYFRSIEVVSDKTRASYEQLFKQHSIRPERILMVGNSLRSDILPILDLGGQAVYIPYQTTWLHEVADLPDPGRPGFHQLEHIGLLPALLERLEAIK